MTDENITIMAAAPPGLADRLAARRVELERRIVEGAVEFVDHGRKISTTGYPIGSFFTALGGDPGKRLARRVEALRTLESAAALLAEFTGPAPAPAAITTGPIVRTGGDPLGRASLIERVTAFLRAQDEFPDDAAPAEFAARLVEAAFQGDDFPMLSIREMVTAEVEALRQMVIDLWEAWAEGKRMTDEGAANIAQHVNAWRPGEPVDVGNLVAGYDRSEAAELRALVVELVEGVPVQRYREILVEVSTWSGAAAGNAAGKARAALAEVDRLSAQHGITPTVTVEAIVPDEPGEESAS